MKYYVVIGHKKGEETGERAESGRGMQTYKHDWVEIIERDDEYSANNNPPGAHQLFGKLDVNFCEDAQYGYSPTKKQEAWLIGRHRITRLLDFGNFGYQFVRYQNTKRIQFPDHITISFDKKIKDNNVNKPENDSARIDIEISDLREQLINCYDKECEIDPLVFKLAKFDNYGDAYLDLKEANNYQDFKDNIEHFVNFMRNYPNSSIFIMCKPEHKVEITSRLSALIKTEHLTNYFEFCSADFKRKWKKNDDLDFEYETFSETIEEFFNEDAFVKNNHNERNFFNVPFKKAKITISDGNWNVYKNSEKFIKFLQYNPDIRLEIAGLNDPQLVIDFISDNSIKANVVLVDALDNLAISQEIAKNRADDIKEKIKQFGYDDSELPEEKEAENEQYRLTIEKYLPQKLNLSYLQNQNADLQVGQNQNQNQNQNQSQQLRQSNDLPYEPVKLEINDKILTPDVPFKPRDALLKSLIGLSFKNTLNAPQTEANIDHLFTFMERIIQASPASKDSYCPLSYSVDELVPGAFYVPEKRNALYKDHSKLFFSPQYASIAIKKDKYAFKPYERPIDAATTTQDLLSLMSTSQSKKYIAQLLANYKEDSLDRVHLLLNKLCAKRGEAGVDLVTRALFALNLRNPSIYKSLVEDYLLTSQDFSEFVDDQRYLSSFETLAKLNDPKKIAWWNKIIQIQCRSNPKFDLNHLLSQFNSFWLDLDKVQKFIPIPEEFPFDDFADAGITLGKMYRIMIKARNRFEQIKSFEKGNISHAFMLFDLFNSTMYCKEMDNYCVSLTKILKAEDAFDKSQLKETYFSINRLVELSRDSEVNVDHLKSYLYVFAAVNGNTNKHNNSDLAFYHALFAAIEAKLKDKELSQAEIKSYYATIMLFAAYGNNSNKECMIQDINAFISLENSAKLCEELLDIYSDKTVSKFFSEQDKDGKMANSEAMPSFHSIAALAKNVVDFKSKTALVLQLIVKNKALSPALQKIMLDAPERLQFDGRPDYLEKKVAANEALIQSIYLIAAALNKDNKKQYSASNYYFYKSALMSNNSTSLTYLNQAFTDIDFSHSKPVNLFSETSLAYDFYSKISNAQCLDDVIFVLQDYGVRLATIKPSEQGLILRTKELESKFHELDVKTVYVENYQLLIKKRLQSVLGSSVLADEFVARIDSSYTVDELKMSFEGLVRIINNTKKDDLLEIISIFQKFSLGNDQHSIAPASLLNLTASLVTQVYPIESVIEFIKTIQNDAPTTTNRKVLYFQQLFEKITNNAESYENNDTKGKLNKTVIDQITAGMGLIKSITDVDPVILDSLFKYHYPLLSITQYLKFLEVLALPTNINYFVKAEEFTEIHQQMAKFLKEYPHGFSELADIATFDAKLLTTLPFNSQYKLHLTAKICRNEGSLNARKTEDLAKDYKQQFAENIKVLFDKKMDLNHFYSDEQLAQPAVNVLIRLLDKYNTDDALHHFERDPWFKRPHKKTDIWGNQKIDDKEFSYQTGSFDMSKQNDVLERITSQFTGVEKSVRKNLLISLSYYINELGYRQPAFFHQQKQNIKVPVRKLSDKALKLEFNVVKIALADLRRQGHDKVWTHKKYQRSICRLLALIREAIARSHEKTAYSTQIDAILLAVLAGDYKYAMQINTGEGKAIIATAIAIAMQTITGKQIVITTSNLSLAGRDAGVYNRLIQWFGMSHATISATTKDKSKLQAQIIHTTGHDFALCHGKELIINNSNRIYLNDEFDYTMSHLTPAINSQSKPNDEENWWIYEEILAYVANMDDKEAKRKSTQQVQGLIEKLKLQYGESILDIERELANKLFEIEQNTEGLTSDEQIAAKEAVEKNCNARIEFYTKRITKLNDVNTENLFNRLIDSAIIAQFVLKKGEGYEVIDQLEQGKLVKKVVPTEGGKPITEGDVLYMYGIHQFLIQKTIWEYEAEGHHHEFMKPSELESTTYFNNYSTQAGSKSIGFTGTVPNSKYKMYEALIGGGRSDVIPPHQKSLRKDAVSFEEFGQVKAGTDHVCETEEQLVAKLVEQITAHDGPALVYCANKKACELRYNLLTNQLEEQGYTLQIVIPGLTEDFTEGERLTKVGRQAQMPKTVTLTVGDGRGIDITPKGKDGLLTICSFVPETVEKILQIFGRSGRNGNVGKTDLFILKSELNKYGIEFDNLEEEFKFLDEIRHQEFDFAIKKIGFLQYEVQKQVSDAHKKTTLIAYMDDLYNQLILAAVAEKVKGQRSNQLGEHSISGRWEPFAMLNATDLNQIYSDFSQAVNKKLQSMQLHNINVGGIQLLQAEHLAQAKRAIQNEQTALKSMDGISIDGKLQRQEKPSNRYQNTVELAAGIEVDIGDYENNAIYESFAVTTNIYDNAISMMQKYLGSHIGVYGFIKPEIIKPYEKIYELFDQQKQVIIKLKKNDTETFYEYLAYKEVLNAINELDRDSNQSSVETFLQNAERYEHMAEPGLSFGGNTLAQIKKGIRLYYTEGVRDSSELLNKSSLEDQLRKIKTKIKDRTNSAVNMCKWLYGDFQRKLSEGGELLDHLAKSSPANNAKSDTLFSTLQMATTAERKTETVQRLIREHAGEAIPLVDEYNDQVKKYKEIIKQQRLCYEELNQSPNTKDKAYKYDEMVRVEDLSKSNMVAFYYDYNKLPNRALSDDLKTETLSLKDLQAAIATKKRKERRSAYLDKVNKDLSAILEAFTNEVVNIEHPLTEAREVAERLSTNLVESKNTYLEALRQASESLDLEVRDFVDELSVSSLREGFKQRCSDLIKDPVTRTVLERDLDWGAYLTNLLKAIANAIVLVCTFLQVSGLFKLEQSTTILKADELVSNLCN